MFPSYFEVQNIINETEFKELINMLDFEEKQDVESHVYNRIDKTNVINKHLRSSRKIEYIDDKLFDWIDSHVVTNLNSHMNDFRFILVRNDIEVVKYATGDYFKKHQDFININSNQFKNYTFLISLICCDKGGETSFHLDEEEVILNILNTGIGNMLIFKKDTIHEGKEVIKGNKYILKGNLISFPKDEEQELLVVSLNNNQYYILDTSRLNNSIYGTFIEFQKKLYPGKKVFHYRELKLNEAEFLAIYQSIYADQYKIDLSNLIDYTQLKINTYCIKLNNFLHKKDGQRVILVSLNDYYNILPVIKSDMNVIPFQLISLVIDKGVFIPWFGIGNNYFMYCDHYLNGINKYDIEDDGFINTVISNIKFKKYKKPYEKIVDKMNDIGLFIENPSKGLEFIRRMYNNNKVTFFSDLFKSSGYLPLRSWDMIADGELIYPINEIGTTIQQVIWENNGGSNMSDFLGEEYIGSHGMQLFIEKIIKDISKRTDKNGSGESTWVKYRKQNFNEISEKDVYNDLSYIQKDGSRNNLDELLNNLTFAQLKQIEMDVRNIDLSSSLERTHLSEFFCNETAHAIIDIVCKFGFIHLNE